MKREIDTSTVREFNSLLPTINRASGQIINKNTEDLNNSINLLDLHSMYKTLYSTTTEHILFKHTQTFNNTVCILG